MINDLDLRQDLLDALEFEPSVDAASIGVAVEKGVVTLTGHVPTYAQKIAAERTVERIKGVKGIAQEIEVRPADSHGTGDDEIARRALDVLRWNTSIPADSVRVRVSHGAVTLTGNVDWRHVRESAERAVRGLEGVTALDNRITVRVRATPEDVRERITRALRRDVDLEAATIRVEVENGTVHLHGDVHSYRERRAAEKAAWSAPGVTAVDDRLRVV